MKISLITKKYTLIKYIYLLSLFIAVINFFNKIQNSKLLLKSKYQRTKIIKFLFLIDKIKNKNNICKNLYIDINTIDKLIQELLEKLSIKFNKSSFDDNFNNNNYDNFENLVKTTITKYTLLPKILSILKHFEYYINCNESSNDFKTNLLKKINKKNKSYNKAILENKLDLLLNSLTYINSYANKFASYNTTHIKYSSIICHKDIHNSTKNFDKNKLLINIVPFLALPNYRISDLAKCNKNSKLKDIHLFFKIENSIDCLLITTDNGYTMFKPYSVFKIESSKVEYNYRIINLSCLDPSNVNDNSISKSKILLGI